MTWSKVCDSLASHPKALRAGREAMGLWVMALSWVGRNESDGVIAGDLLPYVPFFDANLRQKLVDVGLWDEMPDGGVRFHDFADCNPTREELQQQRDRWTAKKRTQRSGRKLSPGDTMGDTLGDSPGDNPGDSPGVSPGASGSGRESSVLPSPVFQGKEESAPSAPLASEQLELTAQDAPAKRPADPSSEARRAVAEAAKACGVDLGPYKQAGAFGFAWRKEKEPSPEHCASAVRWAMTAKPWWRTMTWGSLVTNGGQGCLRVLLQQYASARQRETGQLSQASGGWTAEHEAEHAKQQRLMAERKARGLTTEDQAALDESRAFRERLEREGALS